MEKVQFGLVGDDKIIRDHGSHFIGFHEEFEVVTVQSLVKSFIYDQQVRPVARVIRAHRRAMGRAASVTDIRQNISSAPVERPRWILRRRHSESGVGYSVAGREIRLLVTGIWEM